MAAVEGVDGAVVNGMLTRSRPDGQVEVYHFTDCNGSPRWLWVLAGSDPANPAPQVTTADLLPVAFADARRMLPTPEPRIAPSDLLPEGYAFVNMPTFFWIEPSPGQWSPVSATAALGGLSLTVTAVPSRLDVSTGDGGAVQCLSAPPFRDGMDPTTFDGCEYEYRDSSSMSANGATYPVTASIVWHVTWSASTGESGDLGTLTTTSAVRDLAVAEIQAIVVG